MRIGKIGRADIVLNDYFVILLGIYFLLGVLPQALLLFAAVVMHEVCHVFTARRLGWHVDSVELFPFGGVARLYRPGGQYPGSEATVAIAGPLVSLSLAVLLSLANSLMTDNPDWLLYFIRVNIILGLFNLWPGLPLDGGRVFRAWRAGTVGMARATQEGVRGGILLAYILGLSSIGGYLLRLVDLQGLALAVFIYCAAVKESEAVPYMFWQDFWLRRNKNMSLNLSRAAWIAAESSIHLTRLARSFVPNSFNLIAVISRDGRLEGILTEKEVMGEIIAGNTGYTLGDIVKK